VAQAQGEALVVGNTATVGAQSSTATTHLGSSAPDFAFRVGTASATAILAETTTKTSIYGSAGTTGTGVVGASVSGIGLNGSGGSLGVVGASGGGIGVQGSSNSSFGTIGYSGSGAGAQGVSGTSFGVIGDTSAAANTSGAGVLGRAPTNIGVYGLTTSGTGVLGQATGGGNAGVFQGNVVVNGDFAASGMKSRVVPNPDGFHRTLYCLEAPQPWFEDFAEAQLVRGSAQVKLAGDFAEVVDGNAPYHIFLQPKGDCRGLYVSSQNASGFEVKELQGGTSSLAFNYRVVVKQQGLPQEKATRLRKVKVDAPGARNKHNPNGSLEVEPPPMPTPEEIKRDLERNAPKAPPKP